MNATESRNKIASELESLVSHVNDSIAGYKKAAEKIGDSAPEVVKLFSSRASEREKHAKELNERLKCIGEDEETSGSVAGAAHRGLIALKDLFSSSDNTEAIVEEAIRGEEKLLEYISGTFAAVEVMDGATRRAIAGLKLHVAGCVADLMKFCKAV